MGCGCGGTNKEKASQTTVTRIKQSIKKAWETAQPDKPINVVKRIYKKN